MVRRLTDLTDAARAAARSAVFVLKVLPMLPSRPINWVTPPPVVERVQYPTRHGLAEGDLYRPGSSGQQAGIVVCLGIVPFDVDHPQVPRLGEALARAGFATLIYWSPAMRDLRLDPEDIESIALAYGWLLDQRDIDPDRSGLFGTCVGGSFALMAAAHPAIRDRVAFAGAFAPYSSMWTLAADIASSTRAGPANREPWPVDPLTRAAFVHTLTAGLDDTESARLRGAYLDPDHDHIGAVDPRHLSEDGQAIYRVLTARDITESRTALNGLPHAMRERLTTLSPTTYLNGIHAPLILFGHDRDDLVIPVDESRRLRAALSERAGVRFTEYGMFQHADPTKRKLPPLRLLRELARFYGSLYPMFRVVARS
jgi:hypothetical protein